MRVWIDLTNSPHVLFFAPIARALVASGHEVLVTARRFAHTIELAKTHFDDVVEVGTGSAKSLFGKATSLGGRSTKLIALARRFRPDVAVSHGSYDQAIAAKACRVPSLLMVDYEFQPANHLSFRLARRLLLPEAFEQDVVNARGGRRKTARYRGLKEEVYLADFCPSDQQRRELGIDGHTGPVVTLRPPPEGALYHREGNPLWTNLLARLGSCADALTLVLPRHPSQVEQLQQMCQSPNMRVLDQPVDGPALVWWSDVVISGGGTMNREAVALGTPVWTLFSGVLGSVDRKLIADQRMHRLETVDDVAALNISKRSRGAKPLLDNDVRGQVLRAIEATARLGQRR